MACTPFCDTIRYTRPQITGKGIFPFSLPGEGDLGRGREGGKRKILVRKEEREAENRWRPDELLRYVLGTAGRRPEYWLPCAQHATNTRLALLRALPRLLLSPRSWRTVIETIAHPLTHPPTHPLTHPLTPSIHLSISQQVTAPCS